MIDNRSVGCNWFSIMKLQLIPNPTKNTQQSSIDPSAWSQPAGSLVAFLKRTPQDTQIFLCGISKNPNLKLIIEFFHLFIIPMTLFKDIMLYFDEFIHIYGWNMSILWSPLKIWTPKNFTTANFRHPVSKSWLRHCPSESHLLGFGWSFLSKVGTDIWTWLIKTGGSLLARGSRVSDIQIITEQHWQLNEEYN